VPPARPCRPVIGEERNAFAISFSTGHSSNGESGLASEVTGVSHHHQIEGIYSMPRRAGRGTRRGHELLLYHIPITYQSR
jgi:hypothetical protein